MFFSWLKLRWDYRNLDRFSNSDAFIPIRRWRKYSNYRHDHKMRLPHG